VATGRVKWFNDAKGFGFIKRPGEDDVFVHYSAIIGTGFRSLAQGQCVAYDAEQGPKGIFAKAVRPLLGKEDGS